MIRIRSEVRGRGGGGHFDPVFAFSGMQIPYPVPLDLSPQLGNSATKAATVYLAQPTALVTHMSEGYSSSNSLDPLLIYLISEKQIIQQ